MKLGFIGFGNIAEAMVKGLLKVDAGCASDIFVSAAHYDACRVKAERYGVNALRTNKEVAAQADMVIVAVKPYLVKEVLEEIKDDLKEKIVVSVASGITSKELQEVLGEEIHFIEAVPNTPISVGKGIMNCEMTNTLNEEELELFRKTFGSIALLEFMETKHLAIADCLAGCAPAYTAMYIEALADAGVKNGLSRATAYRLAERMVEGTGAMALEQQVHPGVLKDAVCSPGGKTIKGVASLEEDGFRGTVIRAIDAILK